MRVFIIGVSGAIGGLLAQELLDRGDLVTGLVRREQQRADLAARGVDASVGDLASLSADDLASLLTRMDAVV